MIYLLHKVAPDGPPNNENWNTPTQLAALVAEHGREAFVHLDEYLQNDRRGVVLTFDGIYDNVHRHAWPILREAGVPFELFVVWGSIGLDNAWDRKEPLTRFANWTNLWEMCETGLGRIESHTFWHPDLTSVGNDALRWEVSNLLRCRFLAYPYGKYDARVVAATRAAGYEGAVSVRDSDSTEFGLPRRFL